MLMLADESAVALTPVGAADGAGAVSPPPQDAKPASITAVTIHTTKFRIPLPLPLLYYGVVTVTVADE
jgi:hypothetical protein